MNDFNFKQAEPSILNKDNYEAIELSKNPKCHSRTKHIDVRFHVIREKVKNFEIKLEYCCSEDMIAGILSKPLGRAKCKRLRDLMCVTNGLQSCTMNYKDSCLPIYKLHYFQMGVLN